MATIQSSLISFAIDEGIEGAIAKAEKWRDSLEEMLEICHGDERDAVALLINATNMAILKLLELQAKG